MRFDDGSAMRLYRQTVQDFGLYPGKELADEEMTALRKAAGEMSAKMRAVRIVSATNVSKRDLEQRQIHKGEAPNQAKQAVAWMSEFNLLDDAKTAEQVDIPAFAKGMALPAQSRRSMKNVFRKNTGRMLWQTIPIKQIK